MSNSERPHRNGRTRHDRAARLEIRHSAVQITDDRLMFGFGDGSWCSPSTSRAAPSVGEQREVFVGGFKPA